MPCRGRRRPLLGTTLSLVATMAALPPLPPVPPPRPPFPPLQPGYQLIDTITALRHSLDAGVGATRIFLPGGIHLQLGGVELRISHNVTLASEDSGAVVDAQGLSRIMTIKDAHLTLVSIRLQNGLAINETGGAIKLQQATSNVVMINSTISNSTAVCGGAIDVVDGHATLNGCVVEGCLASSRAALSGNFASDRYYDINIVMGGGAVDGRVLPHHCQTRLKLRQQI